MLHGSGRCPLQEDFRAGSWAARSETGKRFAVTCDNQNNEPRPKRLRGVHYRQDIRLLSTNSARTVPAEAQEDSYSLSNADL